MQPPGTRRAPCAAHVHYNGPMAINPTSRKPLPIEVSGSPRRRLGMSPAQFLRNYWQKRPLLIRSAFADFTPPIEADELAGLACEPDALARLIIHDARCDRWSVKSSPLDETDFSGTPDSDWTLLVQDVDKWDLDVSALLENFNFLPSWRVDDVMVSYAEPGGGVGPHIDQYDVFLLQGLGQRHWAISDDPAAPKAFRDDVELRQLREFAPTHEWILQPGDMLYLPPGIAHDGRAVGGPCMTFSIGMRAPSQGELIGDLADYLAERLPDEARYTDPDLASVKLPGEIDRAAIERVRGAVPFAATLDDATVRDWFGRFITRYRNARTPALPRRALTRAAFDKLLATEARLLRHPWSRMAWARGRAGATVFANGQAYAASVNMAIDLCRSRELAPNAKLLDAIDRSLLIALIDDGHLVAQKAARR